MGPGKEWPDQMRDGQASPLALVYAKPNLTRQWVRYFITNQAFSIKVTD